MTPRRKTRIGLLTTLGVTILVLFFLMLPTRDSLLSLQTAIEEQRIANVIQEERGKNLAASQQEAETLVKTLASVKKHFVVENDELRLFTALENIAAASGVAQSVNLQPASGAELQSVPITITLTGRFANLLTALRMLEQLEPVVLVQSLQLTATRTEGVDAIQALITGTLFWQKL